MSDSIPPIRLVPQISHLAPNTRTTDKKNNKDSKRDFSKHLSDNDQDGGEQSKEIDGNGITGQKDENEGSTSHEKIEDDFDDSCGSILDTEL